MIAINLLPEELRIKEKKIPKIPALKIAAGVGVVFVLLTLIFYIDFLMAKSKLGKLEKEWQTIQPQHQKLISLEQEVETKLKPENQFLNRFVTADRPLTHMMNWANEFLPSTMWLIEFKLERVGEGGKLFVKGLALPSKDKSSIEFIETYVHQLKEKITNANLSLTTTRQKIKNVELTQFIATYDWGIPEPVKK